MPPTCQKSTRMTPERPIGVQFCCAATAVSWMAIVMQSAASDWAATRLAVAIEHVAIALAEPEETQQHILPGRELLRPRP